MKQLLLRLAVSLLTFAIGVATIVLSGSWRHRLQRSESFGFESKIESDPPKSKTTVPEDDITVEGRYANFDYAYSVQRSWIIDPLPNDYPLPPVYEAQ